MGPPPGVDRGPRPDRGGEGPPNRGGNAAPRDKHRVNREIRFPTIRVIAADGEQLGIMSPDEARRIAAEQGLDLVEVAPDARPPVCKIMDYGKYRYELSKKNKPQKTAKLKTIKLRPKTDDHDLATKFNHARKFLADGDRVRFVMRLRGRENAYIDRWCEALMQDLEKLADAGTLSVKPKAEGRAIVAQFDPK
jgi:translation initiation factor IF-3